MRRFDHFEVVSLSGAERATYFELFQNLTNRPIKMSGKEKKGQKSIDRTQRLLDMAGASKSAEDALITCSSTNMSHVNPVGATKKSDGVVCLSILKEKENQCLATYKELLNLFEKLFEYKARSCPKDGPETIPAYFAFLRYVLRDQIGDEVARGLLDRAMGHALGAAGETEPSTTPVKSGIRRKEMSTQVGALNNLSLSFIEYVRGRRFFSAICHFVREDKLPRCAACCREMTVAHRPVIMGLCGHALCCACFEEKERQQESPYNCPVQGCEALAPRHSAIPMTDFKQGNPKCAPCFGSKIDAVLALLQDRTRVLEDDRVLVFVQFGRIKVALVEALEAHGIKFASTTTQVEHFKRGDAGRVCVLDLESTDAAGW